MGIPILYEYCYGVSSGHNFDGKYWLAQSFTPSVSHEITSIKIFISRTGSNPALLGTITASIKATDGSGHPTGGDLVADTLAAADVGASGAWYELDMTGSVVVLEAGVKYAIVCRTSGEGDGSNVILWYRGNYAGGEDLYSDDYGATWSGTTSDDRFEEYGYPSLQTNPATNIRARAATGNGYIHDVTSITQIGFEWGTSQGGPYPDDVTDTPAVVSPGEFALEMDSPALTPNTTYYFRAKMYHSVNGWYYGDEKSFTTLDPLPIVDTLSPTAKTETTATLRGDILDLGDTSVTKRGFVYGLTSKDDPGNVAPGSSGYDSYTEESPGPYSTGEYTLGVTGLTVNKIYYFRAYAYNSDGYDYGPEVPFLTNEKVDYLFPISTYSGGIRFDSSPGGGYPNPGGGTVAHKTLVMVADTEWTNGGRWGWLTGNYVYERNYYNNDYYTDLYNLTDAIIRDTAIMKVKYRATLLRVDYPYGKYKTELRTHSTQYTGAAQDVNAPSGGPTQVCTIYYTNPYTGNAWTLAELDALVAGITIGQSGSYGMVACDMVRIIALWANAEVSNDGATDIGGGDVRLNATIVEDETEPCTVYFEWGETVAYGNTTSSQTDKAKGDSFTADVTLPESGIIHFRPVIETNCGETFYGEDITYDANQDDLPGIWLGDEDDWFKLEITDYILSARTEIGWDDELAQATAGLGEFTGDNHLGYFSPDNASSPLFGYLYIGARITFREIYKGILYKHFTGRIQRIVPNAEKDNQIAYIQVLDGVDDMAGTEISTALFTDTDTGELAAAILDEAAWPAARREIDTGVDNLNLGWFHKAKALDGLRKLEAVEKGRFWIKPNGNARWENRHFRVTGDGLVSQATFNETMCELAYEYSKRLVYNDIQVTGRRFFIGGIQLFSGYDLGTIDDDLIWSTHTGDAAAPYIPQGTTVVIWAEFQAPLYSYDTLVEGTHWNANTEPDGSGTDVGSNITITERQYGQAVRLTITNSGSVGAYITEPSSPPVGAPSGRTLLIYGALYSVENLTIIQEDETSQQTYGKRTLPIDAAFKSNPNELLAYAQFLEARHSEPIPVPVQAKFQARTNWPDDTIYIQTLARHISDRITIVSSLLGISADFYINKVIQEYVFNEGSFVRETTWSLEACEGSAEGVYWLLGVAGFGELGETTRLGF